MVNTQSATAIWLFLPPVFLAYLIFLYIDRRNRVLRSEGVHVFRPIWTIRLFYVWTLVFGGGLMLGPAFYLQYLEPWSTGFGLAIIILAIVTWPPSLYVGWDCLRSARWWGGELEIPWSEVENVAYDFHGFRTVVISRNGRRIEHTLIDSDPEKFQSEVTTRAEHHLALL